MRKVAAHAAQAPEHALRAMLAVMAWGYRGRGRVSHYAAKLVAAKGSGARLRTVAEILARDGAVAGYEALAAAADELPGLGGSYGTKFLHFTQPTTHDGYDALILDRYVSKWLVDHAGIRFNPAQWSPTQYERYLALVHGCAMGLRVKPADVELAIFRAATSAAGNTWSSL